MSALGLLRSPIGLAAHRLARPLGPSLLTGFGVALAAAALAVLFVSRAIVEDHAVADAVAGLSVSERVISVSWVGSGNEEQASLDREARRVLDSLDLGPPSVAIAFRSTRIGTEIIRLTGVERSSALLESRVGRLPRGCERRSCEVVALDAPGTPVASGLRVVGSASAKPGAFLDALIGSTRAGERTLVADGIEGLSARAELAGVFRTLTWAVTLDPDRIDSEQVASLRGQITAVSNGLRNRTTAFDVRAPLQELDAAQERSERASGHLLLVGGQSAAIFAAFVLLAASRMRESAAESRYRLRRLGARRWQTAAETVTHASLLAVPAVASGWMLGTGLGALVASAADRPAGDAIARTALSRTGLLAVVLIALGSVVAIVAALRAGSVEVRGLKITTLDVAAAGLLAVVGVTLVADRPGSDAEGPQGVSLVLPVLIVLTGALVTARLLGAALRMGERVAGRGSPAARLALLSLVRNPSAAVLTVVCLAATVGMAVFALMYRATLSANQRDTAAYAVPLDYRVELDEARVRPFTVRGLLAPLYDGFDPLGIIRRPGEAPSLNRSTRLEILGIPSSALRTLRWRDDYADRGLAELERSITADRTGLKGVSIPSGAEELVLRRALDGNSIRITAHFRRRDGGFSVVDLRGAGSDSSVRAALGPSLRGSMLVALSLGFPSAAADTAAHRATGSTPAPDVFLEGTLTLGRAFARVGSRIEPLSVDYRDWVRADGSGGAPRRLPGQLRLRYVLSQERDFRIRPSQTTDGQVLPAIASTALAAAAGENERLRIRVAGADLQVRIAATARRFPTLSGDFLIVDRDLLETAANASVPGSAIADEAWLRAPPGEGSRLRRRAAVPVRVESREQLEARLRGDPVSRATSLALIVGACLALTLAFTGVLLAVASDAWDRTGELFDLEALGLPPARLTRHLWFRAVFVVTAGLIGGLLTGAATALVVTEGVSATANATAAEPPLVATVEWPLLSAGVVGFTALVLGVAALFARSAVTAGVPAPPETT